MARGDAVASDSARWFTRLGSPLGRDERQAAMAYASALNLGALEIAAAPDAEAARSITCDPDWDRRWWDAEERERAALMDAARTQLGAEATLDALTVAVEPYTVTSFTQALAAPALATGGEALARAASGALLMALHCRALAMLCGRSDEHVFMRKYALFSLGRWPLGIRAGVLLLF